MSKATMTKTLLEPSSKGDSHSRRVLFMVGQGGGGHKASAVALRDSLVQSDAEWASRIELVDTGELVERVLNGRMARVLPSGDGVYNWLMMRGFYHAAGLSGRIGGGAVQRSRTSVEKAFKTFWQAQDPALVISFVPLGLNYLMRSSLRSVCPGVQLLTVITDMESTASHTWIDPFDETAENLSIVVGTATLEAHARSLGYSKHIFRTSGMLVHPAFYATGRSLTTELGTRGYMVVFFGGFAPMRTQRIVRRALEMFPDSVVVVICGGNTRLQHKLERISEPRCIVEGFIPPERIQLHFRNASVILGKPGPGVVSEAAVCGVPFVTERRKIMPQELCVLREIENTKKGIVVNTLERLPADLFAQVERCRDALTTHENRAVFEVSAFVQELLNNRQPSKEHISVKCPPRPLSPSSCDSDGFLCGDMSPRVPTPLPPGCLE